MLVCLIEALLKSKWEREGLGLGLLIVLYCFSLASSWYWSSLENFGSKFYSEWCFSKLIYFSWLSYC